MVDLVRVVKLIQQTSLQKKILHPLGQVGVHL